MSQARDEYGRFAALEMYGLADEDVPEDGEVEVDPTASPEPVEPDANDVSEASDEGDESAEEEIGEDAPNEEDDLAVALEAARQEALAAQQRAAQYEEQLAHIAAHLQQPEWKLPYDALSDDDVARWENAAAHLGSDPRTEYRLYQKDQERHEVEQQAALHGNIRSYFTAHADHAEYGAAVLKMLDADPVNLTPFLPPQHALRDAAWRIDAMFAKARLERMRDAKVADATKRAKERTDAQRAAMKAATRGEPTRQSGVNLGTADSKSSRRTPADEIKASFRQAAKASTSLLDL